MDEPRTVEHWQKINDLGSGAFGVVSLWKNDATDEFIAIKKCKFQSASNLSEKQKRRWENEVTIMKNLNCLYIVSYKELPHVLASVLNKYNPSKLPLLSMEYCTKGNLRHVLSKCENSCGLPEPEVRELLHDITQAVKYLHSFKITHRDIKPENIVLQETASRKGGIIYKLIDLGYAKELNDTVISFVGTLHYLAPEIFKTENYNHSVDYWSLGVLTFEVICGVLPFLPELTPFERFPYIAKKGPEHICIYKLLSGSFMESSNMLNQNHVSACLKQNIEKWLRHVLQFDPTLRSQNFAENITVFDYMLNILKKKIITVFSVNTLEFYSYEINESTLVSTLKDWIARDTKVQVSEQILLTNLKTYEIAEDCCVVNLISDDDPTIYVFKRTTFISRETFSVPKYIRILFENCDTKYTLKDLRPFYIKAIFYLSQEDRLVKHLISGFKLFLEYAKYLVDRLQKDLKPIHDVFNNLLIKMRCYCNIHKQNIVGFQYTKSSEYEAILVRFKRLLAALERNVADYNIMLEKAEISTKRKDMLEKMMSNIVAKILNSCDIEKYYHEAICLLKKTTSDRSKIFSCTEMTKIVSKSMKEKDALLYDKRFKKFSNAVTIAVFDSYNLLTEMKEFHLDIVKNDKLIDENQNAQFQMLFSGTVKRKSKSISNSLNGFVDLDADAVIKENQELRFRFEEMLNLMYLDLKKML